MQTFQLFLQLVRSGIGHRIVLLDKPYDWKDIEALAARQGLSAIVLDGFERLPENKRPPKELLLQWIGNTLQSYEIRYEQYRKAISEMARWYNQHGYKMMILKGYACGVNWPKPEHRPCGDIDIWLFGQQKEADAVLGSWFKVHGKGTKIDTSHHRHTVFYWGNFMVENHYDFVNVHHHKSNAEIEKILKELGKEDSHYVELSGERVYLPSPNLHALFMIRHMVSHFAAAEITLRQVLDWAFFVEKQGKGVDWKWLLGILDKHHMKDFFNCINAICVEDLGFSTSIFPTIQFLPSLKERVLYDILFPKYTADEPSWLIPRLIYKYKRWRGNSWKHEMCYNESLWSAFWSGVWNHLQKPSSI